jgi:hypothetical protein
MPNVLVPITLVGWIPAVLLLFAVLPPRRAVTAAFVFAWLFLPVYGYNFPGVPEYSKITATSLGAMLGVLVFDSRRLAALRPSWYDLPMLAWCCIPFISSMTAGYDWYDGLSGVERQTILWGLPYLIGRLYFSDTASLRELAIGIVIGAIVYVPLCLLEMRLSPQLHKWVYGFHPGRGIGQSRRWGGFRPTVFMQHGLGVALYMCTAAVIAVWLWLSGSVKALMRVPMSLVVLAVVATGILCKSAGALALMVLGVGVVLTVSYLRTRALFFVILALPLLYVSARTIGGWDAQGLIDLVNAVELDRAESMEFRIKSERGVWYLVQPDLLFGRARFDYSGQKVAASDDQRIIGDSMWIGALGKYGLIGLVSWMTALTLPSFLFVRRFSVSYWVRPAVAPSAALATLLALYMWDNMFNGMLNPMYILAVGGLTTCFSNRLGDTWSPLPRNRGQVAGGHQSPLLTRRSDRRLSAGLGAGNSDSW